MSVVFQHWDPGYFETILLAATGAGAELKAAVTQEREVIWSMHKKKNRETMLAGEMILTFYKPVTQGNKAGLREPRPALLDEVLDAVLRHCGSRDEVTSQFLFNRVIMEAWERRSLSQLGIARTAFADALRARGWLYDTRRHTWRRGKQFGSQPDLFENTDC
jgi:hypothetical protein